MTDDALVPMAGDEKLAWAYGITVLLTSGTYFAIIASRLRTQEPEDVAWEALMIGAIVASIVLVIVIVILASIGGAVWSGIRGRFEEPDFGSDERDLAIKRLGDRRTLGALSVATLGALILAMLDTDTFWIGNFLFLVCSLGALVESGTKIRAYRRGL